MGIGELIVVAIGLSMDAFAIAICKGLSVERLEKKHMICAGLWFGGAQALMPLIGYLLGSTFANAITSIDHWLTFGLLAIIGINIWTDVQYDLCADHLVYCRQPKGKAG